MMQCLGLQTLQKCSFQSTEQLYFIDFNSFDIEKYLAVL